MNLKIDYEPGDEVLTFAPEATLFEHKGVQSVRYAPGPVRWARVRFVNITLSERGIDYEIQVQFEDSDEHCYVPPEHLFMTLDEAKQARAEILRQPEYSWVGEAK